MIATLRDLRQRTGDRALLGAYQAAIDRLDALAYRLTEGGSPAPPTPKSPASAPAFAGAARRAAAWAGDRGGA
jgi:hypothetical protein